MFTFTGSETSRGLERANHDLVHLRHDRHLHGRLRPGPGPQVLLLGEAAVTNPRVPLRKISGHMRQ